MTIAPQSPARWLERQAPGGRDAHLLLAARVLMSGERALVSVVVPIYLARVGYSASKLAVMFALVAIGSALMSLAVGMYSDRIGRRPFVIALPLASAAAAVVFMVTDRTALLFVFAALGSFGRGSGAGGGTIGPYQPAEQALLAGTVPDRDRPRLFGLVASASAAGGLLGAVLAASPVGAPAHGSGVMTTTGTYRLAFLVAAVLAVAAALVAVPVREARREPAAAHPPPTAVTRPRTSRRLSDIGRSLVWRLWATNVTNGIAVGLFGPFITYWFYRRFGAGTTTVGLIYIGVNVVTIGTNLLTHRVSKRLGVVPSVVALRSAQAVLLVPMALSPTIGIAAAVYALRMCVQRIAMAVRQSFVMTTAPPEERARVAALSQLPSQGIASAAPLLTGYLFDEVSLAAPFEIAAFFQLVNALSFGWLFRRAAPIFAYHQRDAAGATTTRS